MTRSDAPGTNAAIALVLALPVPGARPEDRLAGLSLALRAVLRLTRQGAPRIVVAIARGDVGARAALDDRRVPASTEILEVERAGEALRALAREGTPVLVARHHVVAENGVYDVLLRASIERDVAVVVPEGTVLAESPFLAAPRALAVLAEADTLEAGLEALARAGEVARVETAGFAHAVTTERARRTVVRELFEACRKPVDGIVSRHLNRHISIFVSKRIVDTAITPNQMSLVTFALGIAGAVSVSFGSYASMLAGAFLMQCNSILDGVDGELARVRFEQSKLGEWIDTVSDDLSNALFYGGLSLAAARLPSPGPTLGALGAAGVVLQLLTMALYYAELARLGRGDFYALGVGGEAKGPKGPVARVVTAVGYATKKDFFIFAFLVAAALGVLPWALVPIAIGTALTFFAGLGLLVKRLGSSTRRERNV